MLKGNWGRDRREARKWKNEQLGKPIKWTGPLTTQAPGMPLLCVPPTQAEKDEHELAWVVAFKKYIDGQLQKLPLLAQEYGIDTRIDAWPLRLLLFLAEKEARGFRLDWGRRLGPNRSGPT